MKQSDLQKKWLCNQGVTCCSGNVLCKRCKKARKLNKKSNNRYMRLYNKKYKDECIKDNL